jgi:hypothetical protein
MQKFLSAKEASLRYVAVLYVAALAYAVLRYVAFAPRNLDHLPVFVLNKGVSMAAALCFVVGFREQWRRARGKPDGTDPWVWFRAGVFGAVAHIPLSVAILRPGYFGEFFSGDRLSFNGEAVVLFGGLTAGSLYLLGRTNWMPRQRWWLTVGMVAALVGHTLSLGIARGLNLNRSHAYLPPMWFLSLIGVGLGAGFLLRSRPPRTPAEGGSPNAEPLSWPTDLKKNENP